MTVIDPVFGTIGAVTKSTNALPISAVGYAPSLTTGDLNIIWINVCPSASSTDPGIPTVDGNAIAAVGSTNIDGWKTVASSYDAGSPGARLTVLARVRQASYPDHVTWAWASAGNYVTGGESWQSGTFDPADPIPSASTAFQAQPTSSATFNTPSVTTAARGVICSLFTNRTGGTWNVLPDTVRGADSATGSTNYGVSDTNAAQNPGTFTKSATFSGATSVGNSGIWMVKANPSGVTNVPPTANAGPDQTVEAGATFTLTGTDADSDGTIASRSWSQVGGLSVTLNGAGASRTVTAPVTLSGASLTFQYSVTDNSGATGTDAVVITVLPASRRVKIGGTMQPSIQRVKLP